MIRVLINYIILGVILKCEGILLMPRHELGIIENIDIDELIRKFKNNKLNLKDKIITYRLFHECKPSKYDCISGDEFIMEKIRNLDFKSYAFNFLENNSFDYYYITIIPPTSLLIIIEKLNDLELDKIWQDEINMLKNKLGEAYKNDKYIIHYGI